MVKLWPSDLRRPPTGTCSGLSEVINGFDLFKLDKASFTSLETNVNNLTRSLGR